MKTAQKTINITFIIVISTILSFGQIKKEEIFEPQNVSDCISYFENNMHPEVIEKYRRIKDEEHISNRYFNSLKQYVSKKLISKENSKLLNYLKVYNKTSTPHANKLVRTFIQYLKTPELNIEEYLAHQDEYVKGETQIEERPKQLPSQAESVESQEFNENLINQFLQGYNVYSFDPKGLDGVLDKYDNFESPSMIAITKEEKKIKLYFKNFQPLNIPTLEYVSDFKHGDFNFAKISINDNKRGIINKRGEIVIPIEYEFVDMLDSRQNDSLKNTVIVKKNGKLGMVSSKNELIIPFEYESLSITFNHGFVSDNSPQSKELRKEITLYARKNQKWGLLNLKGNVIVPIVYDYYSTIKINKTGKEYYIFKQNEKFGAVDSRNNILIPFEHNSDSNILKLEIFNN